MEKDNIGPDARHAVVNGDYLQAVRPQRLQYGREFRIEHCDIAGDHRVGVRASKGGPGIEPHASIDDDTMLAEIDVRPPDRDFVNGSGLIAGVADDR